MERGSFMAGFEKVVWELCDTLFSSYTGFGSQQKITKQVNPSSDEFTVAVILYIIEQ